jgi:hypothetical protein
MSYYVTNENSVLNINNAHLKVSGNIQTDVMKLGAIEFAPPASDVAGTVNFTNVTTGVTTSSNLNVGGTLMLGSVELVTATAALEQTVNLGNVTSNTVQFTNATTSLVASGNVVVTGNVTADYFVGDGSNITGISSTLQAITDSGPGANVTSNTVQFSNTITSLTAASNVVVTGNVTAGSFLGDGSELTALNAANIGSGTLPVSRGGTGTTSSTGTGALVLQNAPSFTGDLTVSGDIQVSGLTIQTVSSYKSDTTIFSGTSVTDISGLSVTITPKFANSKILVSYDVSMGGKGRVYLRVKRVQGSSTSYFWSDQGSGGWNQSPGGGASTSTYSGSNTDAEVNGYPFKRLDNAGGSGSITYTVQGWSNHSVYYVTINRGYVDTSSAGHGGMGYWARCVSSITAQEVCQ